MLSYKIKEIKTVKKISMVIPTYNEENNIVMCYEEVTNMFTNILTEYDYDIIFIDNQSEDSTREIIRNLVKKDTHVKAIFNARNFGQARSHFYGLTQSDGDCAVLLHADLQNPLSAVQEFVREWEKGSKVVIGIKDSSKENPLLYFLRSCYYKVMSITSETEQIQHFSDFELLDSSFLDVLRELDDPIPYLRGIVSELGFKMSRVYYVQEKRQKGKSKANIFNLYDFAMNGITSYTKGIMRLATILGFSFSFLGVILGLITFIKKLMYWDSFQSGMAALTVGVFFMLSVNLFFVGIMGEYVLSINTRVMHRPLVIEEERVGNWEDKE